MSWKGEHGHPCRQAWDTGQLGKGASQNGVSVWLLRSTIWVQVLALPPPVCVTLGQAFGLTTWAPLLHSGVIVCLA